MNNSKSDDCIYCDGTRMQIIQCIPGDTADFESIECSKCCEPGLPTVETMMPEFASLALVCQRVG